MKTLLESISYTKEKKQYQLKNLEEGFSLKPTGVYNDFLNNKLSTKGTVSLNIERQSTWFLWNYLNDALCYDSVNYGLLVQSTKYACLSNSIFYLIGTKVTKYDSYVLLRSATMHLGQMLFLGWDDLAIKYGRLLLKMLDSKHYKGGSERPLYTWFMIMLFCQWRNIELDRSNLRIPDDLGIYTVALNNLTSSDARFVCGIVDEMTKFHILNSDEYDQPDANGDDNEAEFVSANYFVFPVEILMFLIVRERLGMPKLNIEGNELLSLNLNRIPDTKVEYPSNDVVDRIFDKLYADNPDYPKL